MKAPGSRDRLFLRDEGRRARASGLPADVVAQSARRLRILAILYAAVFFFAGFFPALLFPGDRARLFSTFAQWGPGVIAIAVALVVAVVTTIPGIPLGRVMLLGLAFEVVGSYGIAGGEFLDPTSIDFSVTHVGLSWVAVWTLLFAVVVPTTPRRTVLATLASVSSVPVVIGSVVAYHDVPDVTAAKFFFGLVFPYLLVTVMAYVGARVIYQLGHEVVRARELGGYRLVERLGAGGMGEVWRAEHHLLARPAAIKLVRPELAGAPAAGDPVGGVPSNLQERFGREAQATASMRSPHTIEIYDFGLANDGTFYYVMELLEGFDLETLVERFGPIPSERAIHLLAQVCHSLGEAHGEGLIHRDIKPANVFTCRYGREVDFVKVLDFGMVKSRRDDSEATLTGDHAICGTPAFMAPEQVLGDRTVDGRADLYAVGCVAYWLITGQLVFSGRTAMETMMQHAQATPVPPSARTELEVPPALDRAILACLAKNPDDRPASADVLAETLASIETRSAWTAQRAREWWELHHPRGAGGAAAAPGSVPA
ncbi:MAG TPA: serine/threonine-protein kinase [Candidatus Eisenbacteria bacterium]|nr:serine/threonine-protein kinase [Candidatus Eisenbacteria bacterium]